MQKQEAIKTALDDKAYIEAPREPYRGCTPVRKRQGSRRRNKKIVCVVCEREVTAVTALQKYCTERCRSKAARRRQEAFGVVYPLIGYKPPDTPNWRWVSIWRDVSRKACGGALMPASSLLLW